MMAGFGKRAVPCGGEFPESAPRKEIRGQRERSAPT